MKSYGVIDEHTPLTKTLPPDYVYMTNPNRLYRKQVHQFQCCICAIVLGIFTVALAITILYSVDKDIIDVPPLPSDNASLQLLLAKSWPLKDDGVPAWQVKPPTPEELEAAIKAGKDKLAEKDKLEAANPSMPVNSPSYRHQVSIKTSARATNLARSGYLMEAATKTFVLDNNKLKNLTKTVGRGPVLATDWLPSEECGVGPLPPCPPSAYRTIDGSCNNPYKPNKWGVSMRPYRRQLAQSYADGISKPRTATDGSPLPSARDVSLTVHRPAYRDDPKFTVMLAVWGQFMDHDVTATAISLGAGGKPISCCQNGSSPAHPECFPVHLSEEDAYYKQFGITCMEFVRSAPAPMCSLGPREQLNQVSSYLDASVVYGNTPELARALRSYQGGQLKMLETPDGRSLLPISTNLDDGCNREEENAKGKYCFMSGDARANENTHLTSLHTLIARQHNMVASQLADLNPEWSDEKLYQESRKIVAAQMQHVTYNEFLPVLLGPDLMEELELSPKESGYYTDYNPSVDATISNNFASASFRFAHTLLPALMKTVAKDWGSEESMEMHKMLFDPYKLYQTGALDKLVQGAISTKLERADSYFNTEVTQHLFQATGEDDKPSAPKYGLDLVSLNVQRGRDHGLPAYPAWRQYCGLKVPKNFEDMEGMVDAGSLEKMKAVYKSVDDIDMYTGALSEFPIEGGLVGPTVTCLVSDQFKRLKQGDSFWYETDKKPQAFSSSQLDEIRKTTLAGIICDTSDDVTTVQPQVMRSVGPDNARMPCSAIPRSDLTKWMDNSIELKKSAAGGVGLKYAKVSITVTGGMIKTSSGEVLWDGTVPTSISLPLFNVKPTLKAPPSGSFGSGIQWEGTTSVTPDGLEISGSFSYPVYNHGPLPLGTNYSAKWVNGDFSLKGTFTLNDTDTSAISFPGSYESPIYFSQIKPNGTVVKKKFVLGATQDDAPVVVGVEKLPVILVGSLSPDKTSFDWSGDAVITLPSTPAAPKLMTPSTEDTMPTSGAFNVVSGSVKLESSDGITTSLWAGEFPVAIPVPLPYKVMVPGGAWGPLPVFGNGLEWSTSISGSLLEGSFSFPQYNRTFGLPQVNWLSGQFSLEVTPLENVTLEELITPGIKYTSRIIFREEPAALNVKLNNEFFNDVSAQSSIENLIVESQQVVDGVIPVPLIVHGTFSPDKTVFYFNGKIILAVKPSKPKMDKQLKLLKSPEPSMSPWGIPKFGGFVNSGSITAGLDGASHSTIWSGTVPVAIQMPTFFSPTYDMFGTKSFLFGNGVIWSGTLVGTTIKGTYTLPQTTKTITGITTQTWSGEFLFEVSPLWNATLASVFVPGAKYYSKINFQGAKYESGITTMEGVPGADPSVAMAAPIVLQGSFSLDKSTFYWSGNFIITFRNKPILSFKIPPKPPKADVTKPTITLDVTSGTVVGGFIGANPSQVWSGELPATIPYSSLVSKDSWNPIPSPDIIWAGEVKNSTFEGTFAIPTYRQNGTEEIVDWWAGNFSFKYVARYGMLLENFVKPKKKYSFKLVFIQSQQASYDVAEKGGNKLVQFTQGAQEIIADAKPGKVIMFGDYFSKSFYCYFLPVCTEKKEYYWSGTVTLNFPETKNKTIDDANALKMNSEQAIAKPSSQFGGQVVSGSVEGGLSGEGSNVWWTGKLPVEIPTSVFWTNKTKAASGSLGSHKIDWSGTLIGNTLKGSFSFPQVVMNYPLPTVQTWSGQFSFEIEPLWNATLDGLIKSEVQYSSGIYFQGVKVVKDDKNTDGNNLLLGDTAVGAQSAPIILQGSFTPDGSAFLWSGQFLISVKNYPTYPYSTLTLKKAAADEDGPATRAPKAPKPPATPKPIKPKTTVSFTVLAGELSATNGSDPIPVWGGQMPIQINTNLFNPTLTPGGGVAINWSPTSLSPQLTGTFSVTIFNRNGSVLLPVPHSGNFSFHYLTKWGGSFDGLVKIGKQYSCSVIFKDMAKSTQLQSSEESIAEDVPKRFVLGDGESSGTPCSLILTGKTYIKSGNAFYCRVIPFMCSNKPDTTWFSFTGDALLVIKPPPDEQLMLLKPKPTVSYMQGFPRRVNTAVIGGSIVAGPEAEYPKTLWSGTLPVAIPLPVFWSEDIADGSKVPKEDALHAHGVIWSGSQMGPRVEGSFSLPQYSKTGLKWWTGRFSFLFQTNWGDLGDLDEMITSGVNYNSRIIFRDINSPTPLMTPSQFDIDTATNLPIILLGTYAPGRKIFYWSGNTIIAVRGNPWNPVPNLQLGGPKPGVPAFPMKPKQRVGALVSTGSIINTTEGQETPVWSGSIPVTIPLSEFNISKGVNVIWSASTVYPKFSGKYSIPQYMPNGETYKIQWMDGTFSFDLTALWNTSLDIIETGKEYATIIGTSAVKLSKAEEAEILTSFQNLIMESAELAGSPLAKVNLKGLLTPDNLNFIWQGEAWFYPEKNKTVAPTTSLKLAKADDTPLYLSQFGGSVYDGSVTSGTSSFFSLSHTVWSGNIPATIPFSAFWSGSFFSTSFTKGITWTATSVNNNIISGSYSVPQFTWDGITTSVTWYKGDFQFYFRPLWNSTLTTLIQPGVQYYSKISFQGEKPTLATDNSLGIPLVPTTGIKAPIILQGSYSLDRTAFYWSGNFILNVKPPKDKTV